MYIELNWERYTITGVQASAG